MKKLLYSLSPETTAILIRVAVFALVLLASLFLPGVAHADPMGGTFGG